MRGGGVDEVFLLDWDGDGDRGLGWNLAWNQWVAIEVVVVVVVVVTRGVDVGNDGDDFRDGRINGTNLKELFGSRTESALGW